MDKYTLNSLELANCNVEIIAVDLPSEIQQKLEVIGIYPTNKINVLQFDNQEIVILKIDDVKYALRSEDAKHIIVKKVKDNNYVL